MGEIKDFYNANLDNLPGITDDPNVCDGSLLKYIPALKEIIS